MSDLPSAALDYETVVAERFLALRGSGLMLSPLDQEVVAGWERRGIPVAVVCRGLRRGMEDLAARRAGGPRSIRALRLAVEDEWRAYRHGRVGEAPPPGDEGLAARERLEAARRHLEDAARADASRREAYLTAARALAAAAADDPRPCGRSGPAPSAERLTLALAERALSVADDILIRFWLSSLARAERASIGPRLRLLAGPRPRRARPRAYRQTLRSHLLDAARRAGLRCLRGTV